MAMVESHDLLPVHGRVSWTAIFAGTVVALATSVLLSVLGVALGLSFSNQVGERELGIGALIWVLVTTQAALFLGGWVTSQCTVGENKTEAVVYGVLLWALVFALVLALAAGGVRLGINASLGVVNSPVAERVVNLSDQDLRTAGFTDEQISNLRGQFDRLRSQPGNLAQEMRSAAQDPRAAQAAWWTFGGMVLSMFFAVAGALAGSGPDVLFSAFGFRSLMMRETPRETVGR